MDVASMLLEIFKSWGAITQLRQDIVETVKEMEKPQFDQSAVEARITQNYQNHKDLFDSYNLWPIAWQRLNPTDTAKVYWGCLSSQLGVMITKALVERKQ